MSALTSFKHDMHTEGSTGPEHTLHAENWLSTVHWTGGVLPSVLGLSLLGDDTETLGGDDAGETVSVSDGPEMRSAGDMVTAADDPEMVSPGDTATAADDAQGDKATASDDPEMVSPGDKATTSDDPETRSAGDTATASDDPAF